VPGTHPVPEQRSRNHHILLTSLTPLLGRLGVLLQ